MAFSKITYRRRRRRELRGEPLEQRRGFWLRLRNPDTWRLVVTTGFLIYRFTRWVMRVFGLFE